MGVEIYTFIEVDWGEGEPFTAQEDVRAYNLGEFFVWRLDANLDLFYALGYLRCARCLRSFPPGDDVPAPLYPLRGLPPNLGEGVLGRYFHIVDVYEYHDRHGMTPTVLPTRAKRWLEEGLSVEGPPLQVWRSDVRDKQPLKRVSSPDWHCVSWLTFAEFKSVLDRDSLLSRTLADVHALLAAMEAFEQRLGAGRTRLVYWFDNAS